MPQTWQHPSIYASRALRTSGKRQAAPVRPAGALFQLAMLHYSDMPPVPVLPAHSQYDLHQKAEAVRLALAQALSAPEPWELEAEELVEMAVAVPVAAAPRASWLGQLADLVRGLVVPRLGERRAVALSW